MIDREWCKLNKAIQEEEAEEVAGTDQTAHYIIFYRITKAESKKRAAPKEVKEEEAKGAPTRHRRPQQQQHNNDDDDASKQEHQTHNKLQDSCTITRLLLLFCLA